MRLLLLRLSALLFLCAPAVAAQAPVRYEIAFPNRAHHEAEITVVWTDLAPGPLEVRMSRTSPGRYALHEFAKNVYNVRATGIDGREVTVHRPDPHQWTVAEHGGTVTFRYTLYGDRADGTYAGIDRSHAHLNMPATFVWARGQEARAMELAVDIPEGSGWRVATQLVPTDDPARFTAPDLAYFLDSPTEVSDHWLHTWQVPGPDGPQTVRIALHHTGTEAEARAYAEATEAIVAAQADIFGALPEFDHGTYTFLACYAPWVDGDGMEHRNSTVLTSSGSLERSMLGLLGTVSHEFFHAWNIERIRPADLEPFDFEEANMSRALWFGEGFTSYYTNVALWRAGLLDDAQFAGRVGGAAASVAAAPGRAYFSPVEMSMQAPFVDAAVSVDPHNRSNTFISYYTWGSVVGMSLDLMIRQRFPGRSLDHVMRDMWARHGSPEVPYTVDDIEGAVARVTADPAFAADFFRRYVHDGQVPDFAGLLAPAGFTLTPARPGAATLGAGQFRAVEGGLEVQSNTLVGTPLYEAGVDRGDVLLSVDGRSLSSRDDLDDAVDGRRPGDRLTLRYRSRGQERTEALVLAADPAMTGSAAEPTPQQAAFRAAWKEAPR
ncbi:MAG: PDZ domain-containing protein [Longimicrobiales bacterium]